MYRFWYLLTNSRTLIIIGFLALAAFLFLGADAVEVAAIWVGIALAAALVIFVLVWLLRRARTRAAMRRFGEMLSQQTEKTPPAAEAGRRDEVDVIRKRMHDAIQTIKRSKLGMKSGEAALYELPWYMVIGNPAAGKSTAIVNSGVQFPLADKNGKIVQGVAGTRNCDWFFTTDGILLDTAGRYSVHEEDRGEWFSFLDLLKKHRKRAPINGIIIAVSIAELTGSKPEFGVTLAKNLRQRVQELTERLEVFAPVYVIFTKADLIAGFSEFFLEVDRNERDRAWGATFPYSQKSSSQEVLSFFDQRFDELYDGLKELSLASMALNRGDRMPPGVFTFPLEFASIKNPLRAFLATLFEENPYQFKPIFRGFYFTSALQEGASASTSSGRVAQRFGLNLEKQARVDIESQHGFFLLNLFRKVIFADKDLVAQYANPQKLRMRYTMFFAATALVGLLLGGWSWSYVGNSRLVANVQLDLDKAIKLQEGRIDLQSRFEALAILQDRIEQLERYRSDRPWALGLGLYQGELLEAKLREEYFAGVREVMLNPVVANLEGFLAEVNANASRLEAGPRQQGGQVMQVSMNAGHPYKDASPTNVEDAYNALKTYLMLADKSHAETGHLNDQITRFWRVWLEGNRGTMSREQMIRSAERLISFYLSQIGDPSWRQVETKLALVDQTRQNLRRVVHGTPAIDRVYADIKARASTRFPAMTVARIVGDLDKELLLGSHAIPGTFTRDAWTNYIQGAFKDAANKQMQSADWVLKTSSSNDLTLEGSPEQIQKTLTEKYQAEYVNEWKKFVQGVTIRELQDFTGAANAMNRLGDPETSPLNKLINTIYEETSWDNPSLINAGLQRSQKGVINWFKRTILRQGPTNVNIDLKGPIGDIPMGPVGREFSGVANLVVAKDKDASLLRGYMQALSKLRARFNIIKTQGDTGPGSKQFMQQTLEGSGSELADALRYVDEQMLTGMTDAQKQAIRPILVRPLMQTFSVIVPPAETEVNKIWRAQVYEPFQKTLANKYPFSPDSNIEASAAEIGQVFGPEGLVAKFMTTSMGQLVVRRGDTLSPRTWADMGITLTPQVTQDFATWIAPLAASGVSTAAGTPQTVFQLRPLPAPGVTEYTVEIDGQQLRYRNTQSQWTSMVWPAATGTQGARITAVTFDGRTVEILNEPGNFGLKRMIDTASRRRKDGGIFELSWSRGDALVTIDLRIVSSPETSGSANSAPQGKGFRGMTLPETIAGSPPTAAAQTPPAGAPLAAAASQGAAR